MNKHTIPAAVPLSAAQGAGCSHQNEGAGAPNPLAPATGAYRMECEECDGRGEIGGYVRAAGEAFDSDIWTAPCPDCDGEGFVSGWLCNGCDAELDNGVCADCCLVYLDVKAIGDGRFGVAA